MDNASASDQPLPKIVAMPRDDRNQRFPRAGVRNVLEAVRAAATEEAAEDRIFKVMDYVCGFRPANEIV